MKRHWRCVCDCGKKREIPTGNLTSGQTKSCGCLRKGNAHNRKDLLGQVFGKLTVVTKAPSRPTSGTTFGYWRVRCECGNEREVLTANLISGNTKTCGCGNLERAARMAEKNVTHGLTNTPTYISWQSMRKRCGDDRPRYGGRGITIDERWQSSFENFIADMGERPAGTTLDRIDNDGPYSPENCRWAVGITQGNNRGNNRHIEHRGRTQTLAEWAREAGLTRQVVHMRLVYGWDMERALTEPVQRRRHRLCRPHESRSRQP